MTDVWLDTEPWRKPLPTVTEFNRPFFDGLTEHRFLVPRCRACGHYSWVPYPACRSCLSLDIDWTPVSGRATLYTYTIVHRGPAAFTEDGPYVVAMGELVERPRSCLVIAEIVGEVPPQLEIGQPLELVYQDVPSEGATVYHWSLASPPDPGGAAGDQ